MITIRKILCFFGFHHYIDCDECESKNVVSIMVKCQYCDKINSNG
jgi:hypothetical protein